MWVNRLCYSWQGITRYNYAYYLITNRYAIEDIKKQMLRGGDSRFCLVGPLKRLLLFAHFPVSGLRSRSYAIFISRRSAIWMLAMASF